MKKTKSIEEKQDSPLNTQKLIERLLLVLAKEKGILSKDELHYIVHSVYSKDCNICKKYGKPKGIIEEERMVKP